MQSLPYELLQHVARGLLPRYQCRFALTSRQNYDCLYSPLLRWHALKQHIPLPAYKIFNFPNENQYSLIISDNKALLMNIIPPYLYVDNLTTLTSHDILLSGRISFTYAMNIHIIYHNTKLYNKFLKAAQCHKYTHNDYLLTILNSKQPIVLLCSSRRIRNCIARALSYKDLAAIYQCKHLSCIFTPWEI